MTQEFVTLPRGVVELVIEALEYAFRRNGDEDCYANAIKGLRIALEQPQANQPAMTPIAQRKLDSLLTEGYTISGYSIYHEQKHQHGFVTCAGLVGWWKPEGMEYPQPLGEQEPFAWISPRALEWGTRQSEKVVKLTCKAQPEYDFTEPLYTHPQPKRESLTDNQIDKIAESMPGGLEGFLKGWGWRQFARAVLENDHNIK